MDMDCIGFIIFDNYYQYCSHLQSFEPLKAKSSLNFIDILAKSLIANLGNASFTPINNKFHFLQMAIFVALMMGNIIWIAYNGALLSKLVEPSFDKPFHDLESLAKSNYR